MDQYGIGAAFAANLILTVPFIYLGLFLWRSKDYSKISRQASLTELTAQGRNPSHSRDHSRPAPLSSALGKEKMSDGGLCVSLRPEERREGADLECAVGEIGDESKIHVGQATSTLRHLHGQIEREPDHHIDEQEGDLIGVHGDEPESDVMGVHGVSEMSFWSKLLLIFGRPQSLVFFWTATVMGFGFGVIEGTITGWTSVTVVMQWYYLCTSVGPLARLVLL
jgi:hypothetical protein